MTTWFKRLAMLLVLCLWCFACGGGDESPKDTESAPDAGTTDDRAAPDGTADDAGAIDGREEEETVVEPDIAPDETEEPEIVATADPFKEAANWSAFDAGETDGLQTGGYFGVIYDGRYVYHAPCKLGASFHGRALRHDTEGEFKSPDSWSAYDAAGTDGLITVGYAGGAFDGRYVYYAPFTHATARHAQVLRYDSKGDFTESGSWSAYDASSSDGLKAAGFVEAVFDGRYVYFSPFGYDPIAHGRVLRYDTEAEFKEAESWSLYDAGFTGGLSMKGFYGLILEGDYIYFVPFNDGIEFHGRVLRYNTKGDFKEEASWAAYDASSTGGLDTRGYKMAASDGHYIYFVPFRTSTAECHGRVLRYDIEGPFEDAASWDAYDAGETDGLNTKAYVGAAFDGTYIYFCPYSYGAVDYHAMALRYNVTGDFLSPESWSAFEANPIDGLTTKGYKGIVFDGTYLHFTPYHDGTAIRFLPTR